MKDRPKSPGKHLFDLSDALEKRQRHLEPTRFSKIYELCSQARSLLPTLDLGSLFPEELLDEWGQWLEEAGKKHHGDPNYPSKVINYCITDEIRSLEGYKWLSQFDSLISCDEFFEAAKSHDWPDWNTKNNYLTFLEAVAFYAGVALNAREKKLNTFTLQDTKKIQSLSSELTAYLRTGYWIDSFSESTVLVDHLEKLIAFCENRPRQYGGKGSASTFTLKKFASRLASLPFFLKQAQIVSIVEKFADAVETPRTHRQIQRYVSEQWQSN